MHRTKILENKIEQKRNSNQSNVTYPVTYTGLNGSTLYTAENGWKLLSITPNAQNSGNYDIEIISTGLPMGVYYASYLIDSASWKGTTQQCTDYNTKFETTDYSTTDVRIKAAAGLYYNFESMSFTGGKTTTSTANEGYFNKIGEVNSGTKTGAELLKVSEISSNIAGIRVATKADIESIETTASARDLDVGYWLASPYSGSSGGLWYVDTDGRFYSHGYYAGDAFGVRCVISISNVPLQSNT